MWSTDKPMATTKPPTSTARPTTQPTSNSAPFSLALTWDSDYIRVLAYIYLSTPSTRAYNNDDDEVHDTQQPSVRLLRVPLENFRVG